MTKAALAVLLLTPLALAQNPYGHPTAGTGGFDPVLTAPGPWIGNAGFGFQIQCANGAAPAFVVLSAAPTDLNILGVDLLVDPSTMLISFLTNLSAGGPGDGQGFVPLPLSFAPTPSLIGSPLYAQLLVPDLGSPGGLFAASRGLRFELGASPLIFVGCSIASSDPFQLIDPATNTIVDSGAPAQVDNTTAAAFARGGKRLFVASSIRGTIGMADVETLPATWTTIFSSTSCYGLVSDPSRGWLWTLTDPGTGTRELTAIDIAEGSPNFGTIAAHTTNVVSGTYERWALSPTGQRAAVLTLLPGTLTIVDTETGSATYLQNLHSGVVVPVDQFSPISLPTQVRITPDDRYAIVLVQLAGATPAEIARFDLATGAWVDHNPGLPGTQNMSPMSSPPVTLGGAPNGIAMGADGSFAIVTGFNGCGWAGRLFLDPKDVNTFGWLPWSPGPSLSNAWAVGLSGDETEAAIATWPSSQCSASTSPALLRVNALTGALLGTVPIPFNSNSNTLQNLYTVVYR